MKKLKYADYSLGCVERFQLQQDQLEAITEVSKTLVAMIQEALDLGVSGKDCANAANALLLLIPKQI